MYCPSCNKSSATASAVFCGSCGSKLILDPAANAVSADSFDPYEFTKNQEPKRSLKGGVIALVVGVAILIVFVAASVNSNSTPVDSSASEDTYSSDETYTTGEDYTFEEPIDWYPEGFEYYDDDLAYKFVTFEGSDPCSSECSFWKVKVISQYGCPNGVYLEMNISDSSGTVIDWTNDSVPSLGANQSAVLNLITYDDSADSGTITDLVCHG